ncbi:hypothetical protein IF128_07885 [Empedobacter stercoris]|uniref:hypothetical protein n=1 Tax=Empedobacter stercoris TaxID=1628248 RepID=UPI001662877B|nr:hypothetical protein [Empedobacter stercoris]MCA4809659.1 hypothetical protein [Empedobacter stercoris]QNT14690.1 hypothetical protein HNV03_08480 [Empedobacter stercoris]
MTKNMYKMLFVLSFFGLSFIGQAQILNSISRKLEDKADKLINTKRNKSTTESVQTKKGKVNSTTIQSGPFQENSVMSYDFVSGNQIIFEDDFSANSVGNMATKWTSNGMGRVENVSGYPGKWLRLYDDNTYKIKELVHIPENFTLEFDVVVLSDTSKEINLDFGFDYVKGVTQHYYIGSRNPINIRASYRFDNFEFTSKELDGTKRSSVDANMSYFINNKMNIKISVEQDRMKTYVNNYKILDTEMVNPQTKKYFYLALDNDKNPAQVYLGNFKITQL